MLVPKRRSKSSKQQAALQAPEQAVLKKSLAKLYRVAAADQFARLEEDPTLDNQEKLAALYEVFESLVGTINRLSSPAPSKAPELWSERDKHHSTENINDFILRVYKDYKPRGMTMGHLSRLDAQAYQGWHDWRKLPKNRNAAAPLLTKKQANDRALAQMGGSVSLAGMTEQLPHQVRDLLRLRYAASNRRRSSKKSDGTQ